MSVTRYIIKRKYRVTPLKGHPVDNSVETVDNSVDNSVDNYPQRKRKTKITPYIKKKKYKEILLLPERGPKGLVGSRQRVVADRGGKNGLPES